MRRTLHSGKPNGEMRSFFVMAIINLEVWPFVSVDSLGKLCQLRVIRNWIVAIVHLDGSFAVLINVYGYNNVPQNRMILETLTNVIAEYK